MSQQKLDSRRQQNTAVCSKKKSPLAPRDGSGGRPYAQATAAPAPRSQNRIFLLAFPIHSPAQFSYPSVQCTGLISWREKTKCSCVVVVRRFDAFPSLPGIVPHRKKERRAAARPVANTRPVQRERAAQTNVSCYTESPAGHRGPSGKAMIRRGTDHSFFHWGQKQDEEAKLSELYKADHYISRWRKKLLRASLHSLRGSRTAHSWKSEGPYYLPNPSLRGTVDRKAPSKPPHSSKREGKGPMYLHDPCRFYPIYTRSQSPIGPATTPQNESSCGTFYLWRNSGGT
ncbi:hypothetical protein V6N11_014009 [Hibiscus sabdariffa]|uniref:Uncharacterized protein n=2 Tax=Hibiscus sabdariffa TaxID=183260 RepID=A0ABR2AY66_9ROSI